MAWNFGDSFDLYASITDGFNGYWDATSFVGTAIGLTTGRFSGSRGVVISTNNGNLVKTSGVNDPVHHFAVSFQQTVGGALNNGIYFELFDGATAQCSIVFRNDGAIVLTSGGPGGATLATYTGAFPANNTWYAFEFEVVINNTAGSFAVRKNGNNVNDFTLGSLNTRPTSANNYANKLQIGANSNVPTQNIDDFFWQSGAATGTWLGDIRCYARMPASDQSVTFSRSATTMTIPPFLPGSGSLNAIGANTGLYAGFVSQGSSLVSVTLTMFTGYTSNVKCAVFACVGNVLGASGSVGAVLGTATAPIVNPIVGANTFTFSPAISLSAGTLFYIGICSSGIMSGNACLTGTTAPYNASAASSATAYASFPLASPSLSGTFGGNYNLTPTFSPTTNSMLVSEPQQDGLTTYVYDSNPGDADFYGTATIGSTPASVIATTVRAYAQKSDAGTRTAAVQLKSGATTVASPTLALSSSGWLWAWRTDVVDPNTGAAWTPAAVDSAQIGPVVVA